MKAAVASDHVSLIAYGLFLYLFLVTHSCAQMAFNGNRLNEISTSFH